jgi:hypothetical protein
MLFHTCPPSSLCRLIIISFRVWEEQREIMIFVVINAGTTVISYSPTNVMDCMVLLLSSEDVQNAGTMESVTFTNKTSLPAGSTYQICGVIGTSTPSLLQFN